MMPKSPWYIHAHVVAATMPGTTHGTRMMLRTSPRSRIGWSSAMPTDVPSRSWSRTEPPT